MTFVLLFYKICKENEGDNTLSILSISGLTHVYDDKLLFEDAELNINNGEHIGVVGLNGAGKSTFMKILCQKVMQDEGEVLWNRNIRYGYLDQHADIDRTKTVMEYLLTSFEELYKLNDRLEEVYKQIETTTDYDEMDKLILKSSSMQEDLTNKGFYDLESRVKKVGNGLGLNAIGYDTPIKNLSGGQRAKVLLSKLILEDVDVMLLDEPTNFLDLEHIDWLAKYLESYEGTFILISHDTDFLNRVCKIIINIENKQMKKYTGNYDEFMKQRDANAKQYEESYERQQREIKKMEDYIARNKARAATAGMANSRKKMLDRIDVMKRPIKVSDARFNFPYSPAFSKEFLVIKDLVVGYDKPILPAFSLTMSSTDKVWIRGTNGIGKSTIIKTIMNLLKPFGGSYSYHVNAKVGYLEQDSDMGGLDKNAVTYMNNNFPRMSQSEIRNELAKVGIVGDLATKPMFNLSGGEQVRIRLCKIMQKETNILILDEPTNHLDVNAKDRLFEALEKYEGAIILVSHEPQYAKRICEKVIDIE